MESAFISLPDVLAEHAAAGRTYTEFLRVPDLNAGVHTLPAGSVDGQSPHKADVPHRFEDIEEDLQILVLFATAR